MILMTGGSGLLGKELLKYDLGDHIFYPTRKSLDLCDSKKNWAIPEQTSLIVHCAAYTDVTKAETEKELCYETNVIGTERLASFGIPMIYISTEYVFDGKKGNYAEDDVPNPQNFYALTKLLGEFVCRRTRSVVIRTLFKPDPFEHCGACTDQFTSGGYVKDIARELSIAIRNFERLPQTLHIGFERISTYNLAKKTRPDVIPITVESIAIKLPRDTSLNCERWKKLKETL